MKIVEALKQNSRNDVYSVTAMRTVKVIVGIVCWAFALFFFLGVAGTLADHSGVFISLAALFTFAAPAIFFAITGWLLISTRSRPISRGGKAIAALTMMSLFIFIVAIIIPNFVRMRYASSQNWCVGNLRQLQAAKQEWALEKGEPNNAMVTVGDITPYIQLDRNGNIPKCPAGGTYILGRVDEDVRCSIGTSDWPNIHALSETNNFTWEDNFKAAYGILFGLRHVQKP